MTSDDHKTPMLEPDDFVIVRKRKKYRFAQFANTRNCYELVQWQKLDKKSSEIVLEVGAGTGLFLVELATLHPEKTYIALDVKADRLQKGGREAESRGLNNIFFVRSRADQLLQVVSAGSVQELWLTFSDPFPKKSDAKRRLTAPNFLEIYKKALVFKNAELYMKTDSHALFDWSLEQFAAHNWQIQQLTNDLHESNLEDEYKIMTTYEKKWTQQNLPIYFVSVAPNHR
ncbi:tRNA (guanosine(46)-N7)-methyltransferase TrmB [Candidatus Saccharibacteria bacterium]|nr:tRNA (guanosine(46)-N7)-methyltransferase TrmB [Candidatus Saccharibacteria bacterium]NCU40387.1 tRNA (guanosine(46)-N7)-methyltransferase TrmB [Candidatus Saccharibacteria bacterium]